MSSIIGTKCSNIYYMNRFSERLRDLRNEKGISRAELAEKLYEAVLASRQDCFRGNKVKERKIKRAIEAVIKDKGQAEELLALVRGQREY